LINSLAITFLLAIALVSPDVCSGTILNIISESFRIGINEIKVAIKVKKIFLFFDHSHLPINSQSIFNLI